MTLSSKRFEVVFGATIADKVKLELFFAFKKLFTDFKDLFQAVYGLD